MKKLDLFFANIFFILHLLLGAVILFGWLFPKIKFFYLLVLMVWFLCWAVLGYCPITKWEFSLRKKYRDDIDNNTEFIQFYVKKFFNITIPSRQIIMWGFTFFVLSLVLHGVFTITDYLSKAP